MEKKVFFSDKAPVPKGPYSQAIIHNNLLYISGQIAIDPNSNEVIHGTIEEETNRVMDNLKIILKEAGADLKDVLKINCYLTNSDDTARFNAIYCTYFDDEPPARSCVIVIGLPAGAKVEIDAIAALRN